MNDRTLEQRLQRRDKRSTAGCSAAMPGGFLFSADRAQQRTAGCAPRQNFPRCARPVLLKHQLPSQRRPCRR